MNTHAMPYTTSPVRPGLAVRLTMDQLRAIDAARIPLELARSEFVRRAIANELERMNNAKVA